MNKIEYEEHLKKSKELYEKHLSSIRRDVTKYKKEAMKGTFKIETFTSFAAAIIQDLENDNCQTVCIAGHPWTNEGWTYLNISWDSEKN